MSGGGFAFDAFLLDTRSKRLLRGGELVPLTVRQFEVLHMLVRNAGQVVDIDTLMKAAWRDVTVNESSIHKIVSEVRKQLGINGRQYICNRRRHGYYFDRETKVADVVAPEVDLEVLTEPHRIWIEGRAALETLEEHGVRSARVAFEDLVLRHPRHAPFHIGLANACLLQFESTRTDEQPDRDALRTAVKHAHEACLLNPDLAEAWATSGFVLERTGARLESLAALQRAVMLEPDNWLIQLRRAAGSSGEERYRAARRTLDLYPHFPQAHWFVSSVFVARNFLDRAEREIDAARATVASRSAGTSRFSTVANHWLKGRLCLARGAEDEAMAVFHEELALESRGHLYARECCANTWCDIAAIHLRRGQPDDARAAVAKALERVPRHFMAGAIFERLEGLEARRLGDGPEARRLEGLREGLTARRLEGSGDAAVPFEYHIAEAARFVLNGNSRAAADYLAAALAVTPPGVAGWQIPIEPTLRVFEDPDVWCRVLQMLADRAS